VRVVRKEISDEMGWLVKMRKFLVMTEDGRGHGWELTIWLKITVYSRIPPPPRMERSQYMDGSSSTRSLDIAGGC
jgi:hypothetical protein